MRMSVMMAVFLKELKELLRDRRSLLVMFGVPLVVYPVLFAGIGKLAQGKVTQQRDRTAKIVVENETEAPELLRRLNLPEARLDLQPAGADDTRLSKGDIDAVLVIANAAEKHLLSDPTTKDKNFTLRVDRSRNDSDAVLGRLRRILNDYENWIIEQRLKQAGVSKDVLSPVKVETVDIATQDQRLGRFLGQLLPLLLLITGMLGAFFPALNATTTERELGTLETLLVSPVKRMELLIAKSVLVLLCSMLTAGMNLVSMSAVFANLAGQAKEALGSVSINFSSLFLAYLATIPALVLFSAMVMCVGMIARTFREANSFAAPVMMLPMAAMAIGMADPESTKALMATPVANTTLIIRDILTGRVTATNFLIAAGSNLLFAGIVLSIAARLFTNEQLVNPAWEPISLKGLKRSKNPNQKRRIPTIDEALIVVALGVLIQFYAGPWLGKAFVVGKLNAFELIAILMGSAFLVPAALLSWLGRYDIRKVFSFEPPAIGKWMGALLLGLGMMPLAMGYGQLQSYFLPAEPSDAAKSVAKLIDASFDINPWVAAALFGILPGICEEIVFRGVVLSSLRKRMGVHASVWLTGALFALVHMDASGMVPRTVLGAMLGYMVVYSGSILPAMLLHAAFNSSQIGLIAWYAPHAFATTQPSDIVPEGLKPLSLAALGRVLGGMVLVAVGWWMVRPAKAEVRQNSILR